MRPIINRVTENVTFPELKRTGISPKDKLRNAGVHLIPLSQGASTIRCYEHPDHNATVSLSSSQITNARFNDLPMHNFGEVRFSCGCDQTIVATSKELT